MKRIYCFIGSLAAGCFIGSCVGGDSVTGPPASRPIASVAISSDSATLNSTASVQLTATARDASGDLLRRRFEWGTSDSAIAIVSPDGVVTAIGPGSSTITATSEGKSATSVITVAAAVTTGAATETFAGTAGALSGTWTQQRSAGTVNRNGLGAGVGSVDAKDLYAFWNASTFTNDQYSQVRIAGGLRIGLQYVEVTVRASGTGDPSHGNYLFSSDGASGVGHTELWKTVAGTPTLLRSFATTFATNDVMRIEVKGQTITCFKNGVSLGSSTDASLAGGSPGVGVYGNAVTIDDWEGNSLGVVSVVPVATVTVSPATATVAVGSTQQLTATTKDSSGAALTGRAVTWSSDAPSVSTVSSTGLVTAVSAGAATITATSETQTGTSSIAVPAPAPVATVTVSPATATVVAGSTQQLTATTKDSSGATLTGRAIEWSSDAPSVSTVSSTGLVTAVAAGSATITATSETQTGTSSITVPAPVPVATVTVSPTTANVTVGSKTQLTATDKDSSGATLTGRAVVWSSGAPSVSTVSSTGLVTAVGAGTATITATSEEKSAAAVITVAAALTVIPREAFTGTAGALSGTWTQQRSSGTVNRNGSGLGVGSVNSRDLYAFWNASTFANDQYSQVRIAGGLRSGSRYVEVTVRASGTGDRSRSNYLFSSDGASGAGHTELRKTVAGTATLLRSFATTLATNDVMRIEVKGQTITCFKNGVSLGSSTDASLASGSPGVGVYGNAVTIDDWEGNSLTPVSVVPVATVTVSPPTATVAVGSTQQLTATTRDAGGAILTGRTVTWASGNTGVTTVSSSGLVTAVSAGAATITAMSETQTGTSSITVPAPAPVATVTVSPATADVAVGAKQQMTAALRDLSGNVLAGRAVAWSSSAPAVAAVDGNGLVSGVGAGGPVTITATSETKTGMSSVTVQALVAAGPLRVSAINPRYFADPSGRVVYLTGSEYWKTIQDNGTSNPPPTFDYPAFLSFLQRHNHNFTRLYMWEQSRWSAETSVSNWFSPNLYVRTGPETGADGGLKSDLAQINPDYLARLRQRVIDAGARGIYVSVMLFDGWSVGVKGSSTASNPWLGHPFNSANNINGINGDPNGDANGMEIQTLSNPAITALQDTYVRAVIDAVNDLDNVIYEISNESDPSGDAWQYHMINLVHSYEATKPKQHPVGMTVPYPNATNTEVLSSSADWVSMNGDANNPVVADGSKVSLWDTDHLCGICGDAAWPWRSLTRGHNPLFMDGYDGSAGVGDPKYDPSDPKWEAIRTNMGYARSYALRMDLARSRPRGDLASSGYCLAVVGSEYLVFLPSGGSVNVNLAGVSGPRAVEWFNPSNGQTTAGPSVNGGGTVTLNAPFSGMAIAYIHP